jgi:alpha-ribazole phosphatase/probable phosphoglycerate mutase
LLKKLADEPIDRVYTSDLQRAAETADAVARSYATQPIAKPALREIRFGEWEGLTWKEIEERDYEYSRRWVAAYPNMPAPGGEEFQAFQRRILDEVEQLAVLAADRSVAVVTHAGVMRVVLQALCGLDGQTAWARTESYCSSFRYSPESCL